MSGSELSPHIPSWHAAPLRPRGVQHRYVPELRCRHGLRRLTTGSALPKFPQPVSTRASPFRGFTGSLPLRPARLLAPLYGSDWDRPAFGDFYFQAFNGSVSLSVAGYNYNSGRISFSLAGLAPAGMAASFAARSKAENLQLSICFPPFPRQQTLPGRLAGLRRAERVLPLHIQNSANVPWRAPCPRLSRLRGFAISLPAWTHSLSTRISR